MSGRRPGRSGVRRWALAVLVLVGAVVLAGCVRLPESGPVTEVPGGGGTGVDGRVIYDPLPPLPDASATEIVQGFLDAMTAVPIQTTSAGEFLTQEARASWRPELATITYTDASPPTGDGPVRVELLSGDRFGPHGSWEGALDESERELAFDLVLENGEWRIAGLPDALVVPQSWFDARFRQRSLYFFDPSGTILVPEPVFVADDAVATRLVQGLLAGPPGPRGTARTSFPDGARVELSVPVSDGVADIVLVDAGVPSPDALRSMVTQLAWTLRQVPGIEAFTVSVDGEPVQLPGASEGPFPVELGEDADPAGASASAIMFGLRAGRLVGGVPGAFDPVGGPLGARDTGLREVSVDLPGVVAAGVTADGTRVVEAPVLGDPEEPVREVYVGSDVLRPAWDFAGRLWLVDRAPGGARVVYRERDVFRELEVPGITGERVRALLVSRDGSRLAAVLRRGAGSSARDRLWVSRVRHDALGRVVGATRAVQARLGPEVGTIRDVAWASPTAIGALTSPGDGLWEVRTVAVDGSPASQATLATLDGRIRALAGSPVEGEGLVVLTATEVLALSGDPGDPVPLDSALTTLDFVG